MFKSLGDVQSYHSKPSREAVHVLQRGTKRDHSGASDPKSAGYGFVEDWAPTNTRLMNTGWKPLFKARRIGAGSDGGDGSLGSETIHASGPGAAGTWGSGNRYATQPGSTMLYQDYAMDRSVPTSSSTFYPGKNGLENVIPVFGFPSKKQDIRPELLHPGSNFQAPEHYLGLYGFNKKNPYVTTIIVASSSANQSWDTALAAPVMAYADTFDEFRLTTIEFNDHVMQITPYESVPALVTNQKWSETQGARRYGRAMQLEKNFTDTETGKFMFKAMLGQIKYALKSSIKIEVYAAMLSARVATKLSYRGQAFANKNELFEFLRKQVYEFGRVQKRGQDALALEFETTRHLIRDAGGEVATTQKLLLVVCMEVIKYVVRNAKRVERQQEIDPRATADDPEDYSPPPGWTIRTWEPIRLNPREPPVDFGRSPMQVGEYHKFGTQPVANDQYKTSHMDGSVFIFEQRTYQHFRFRDIVLDRCGLFANEKDDDAVQRDGGHDSDDEDDRPAAAQPRVRVISHLGQKYFAAYSKGPGRSEKVSKLTPKGCILNAFSKVFEHLAPDRGDDGRDRRQTPETALRLIAQAVGLADNADVSLEHRAAVKSVRTVTQWIRRSFLSTQEADERLKQMATAIATLSDDVDKSRLIKMFILGSKVDGVEVEAVEWNNTNAVATALERIYLTDNRFFEFCLGHNIPFPFQAHLVQPHITHEVTNAVAMVPGNKTMGVILAEADASQGYNTKIKVVTVVFTIRVGAFVFKRSNICNRDALTVDRYTGGGDARFFNHLDANQIQAYISDQLDSDTTASIFALAHYPGENVHEKNSIYHLSGEWPDNMLTQKDVHYAMAPFYSIVWGWEPQQLPEHHKWNTDSVTKPVIHNNLTVFEGASQYSKVDPNGNVTTWQTICKGHHGPTHGPDAASAYSGESMYCPSIARDEKDVLADRPVMGMYSRM